MTPIFRQMFRSQSRPGQAEACVDRLIQVRAVIDPARVLTASVFRYQGLFFFYYEAVAAPIDPQDLFGEVVDLLLPWPGETTERFFIPLVDIFHCVEARGLEHWRRKSAPERVFAQLARLKPEMTSSYIFYHYQLQEEKPGSFDKYCLIGLHEDLLFFYLEHPFIPEPGTGRLSTSQSPRNWQEVMNPHFLFWQDAPPGQDIWRTIDTIITIP
jgi:hypothetical protein